MPLLRCVVIFLLLSLSGAAPAQAARLALVIGNDSYSRVESLRNARADAKTMARAREAAGFRVSLALDQDQNAMKATLRRFKASLAGGDEAVFFYAGHGVELGGVNYLLPTDIRDDSDDQLQDDAIPLQRVLSDLAQQKPKFSLAIIDACRDDPFKGNGRNVGSRGLAPVSAVTGQMIIYSAGAGQKSLDRLSEADKSPNGVFTRVFVKAMEREGVSVQELVGTVREEVARLAASVGREQVPAAYDQVIGKFYFRGSGSTKTTQSVEATPAPGSDGDEQIWQEARRLETVDGYEAYLEAYPKGKYASMALAAKRKQESAAKVEVPQVSGEDYPPGKAFRDCGDCPEMVVIPPGQFVMGSPPSESGRDDDEGPPHNVRIAKPFAVGKYEVTFNEWNACARDKACAAAKDEGWDQGRRPVINVNYDQAVGYAEWLSDKTGKKYRLLSEAEWEYAARGGSDKARFWGSSPDRACQFANAYDVQGKAKYDFAKKYYMVDWPNFSCDDDYPDTAQVGSFKPNPFGLYDMLGNVREWVEDCYNKSYDGAPTDGRTWATGDCSRRVVRGGSWNSKPAEVRSAKRGWNEHTSRTYTLGFRVARTLP